LDDTRSIHPRIPFYHDKEEKITPGEIVRLSDWNVDCDAGESVPVDVGGQVPSIAKLQV